eukprot:CAMPEP_0118860464 /NCGR_PEP_ID=MMETSP1163-20130328/6303_2 /TAXON_ID=124430 /ORGANISM="Phaeomonas parva, Strain CCMP2877" /LENGTH=144 /DNA_ID=CAMNT_0006794155 /DNA_START=54 /DNA_END=486 /DNA_ORIENTATION=-
MARVRAVLVLPRVVAAAAQVVAEARLAAVERRAAIQSCAAPIAMTTSRGAESAAPVAQSSLTFARSAAGSMPTDANAKTPGSTMTGAATSPSGFCAPRTPPASPGIAGITIFLTSPRPASPKRRGRFRERPLLRRPAGAAASPP